MQPGRRGHQEWFCELSEQSVSMMQQIEDVAVFWRLRPAVVMLCDSMSCYSSKAFCRLPYLGTLIFTLQVIIRYVSCCSRTRLRVLLVRTVLQTNQQYSYRLVLSPFNVALALSIGRIHSFEDQVISFCFLMWSSLSVSYLHALCILTGFEQI